ncbi:gliding motility-associated peptidyl-prolyl isomerase GldI [Flavobacterium cellulosilyticum]|uniref:Peptidyl-prolyl cis-trans isomerase n=1 Tax=Flavobacterium cellulosilyticum TaxID=2541731 RepID=A0A4R5CF53_9FLAO|nr:gliding motility-associated peptidyl-prolyl isomerase GldI [Flavobacterium cellulosilyticum]TDD96923.1 gliding motility-associated peptidyl-prolyl isomerase GldI [Flavobacterium cellulosilyticum]
MKYFKLILFVFLVAFFASSCKHSQEARRPLSQASGTFIKKSIERNKKIIAGEEGKIDSVIKSNPKIKYLASKKGYWYTYIIQNKIDTIKPKKGDIAFFNYEIKDIKGNIIYSELELRPQTYAVDKQNIMAGIRDGIKLMHKNEKVTFLFPSHVAYGFHGDEKKIGPNQPLICTIYLLNFISEEAFDKEIQLKKAAKLDANNTEIQNEPINEHKDSVTN